jgi:2,3-bisphosphoglycerate-independent phosphoglycerate mutase
MTKPVVLIVLDGWGLAPPGPGNAIALANTPNMKSYWANYPHTQLAASGEAVGLPAGEDGNTETGHINLGAGRVVYQDLPRINNAISDGTFFQNDAFSTAMNYACQKRKNIHLMGVLTDAGVHASREHLFALLQFFKESACAANVYLHLFTDGRDAPPQSGVRFLEELEEVMKSLKIGEIATIMGRYYAMDRDRRWERTQKAYEALTEVGKSKTAPSARAAFEGSYAAGVTDEFLEPTIILDTKGAPYPRIGEGDAVIFFNYRIDRPRQLTRAFVMPNFEQHTTTESFDPYAVKYYHKHVVEEQATTKPFTRSVVLRDIFFVTMTQYERGLNCTVAFPPQPVPMPLGKIYAEKSLMQLRMSESEKERFVGFYFNGMREEPFTGEDRIIVPSPKVATYDLMPQMSSQELTQKLVDRLSIGVYSFLLINFANPDMVAHTGNIAATTASCSATDVCVGAIVEKTLQMGGACLITADHGNAEEMLGVNGEMDTEHSTFPVPLIFVAPEFKNKPITLPQGKLADIAPTVLAYQKVAIPPEMTGKNLLADVSF